VNQDAYPFRHTPTCDKFDHDSNGRARGPRDARSAAARRSLPLKLS
jgi:hypothetical protein